MFSGTGTQNPEGNFEILAITAGEGNGWIFSSEVLQSSLPLWDQVQSFIDHSWGGRSVRDLAGVCTQPQWDAERSGIRLMLTPAGPSAALLREVGVSIKHAAPSLPEIGFSADLLFSAEGNLVDRIEHVFPWTWWSVLRGEVHFCPPMKFSFQSMKSNHTRRTV